MSKQKDNPPPPLPPTQDQLKQHINSLLEESEWKLVCDGKVFRFRGPGEQREFTVTPDDAENLKVAEAICQELLEAE